jgi:predicted dehydrogenase
MGREFASAAARWGHLHEMGVQPEIVAICGVPLDKKTEDWYRGMCPGIKQATEDYKELLANPDVDAVYCAVPHNLHEEFYSAAVKAGKHLLGEKPFGIDKKANDAINKVIAEHPDVFVRCSSEFPFSPAVVKITDMIENGEFGKIIEVEAGFKHSSDLNPDKPINWKRMIDYNGEYGCMGDLGMHTLHVPFRAGWKPKSVRAVLSNIMAERPDGKGGTTECETWDNATLLCETKAEESGDIFPMTIKTQRIAPGESNTWYLNVFGTKASARFSTKNINMLELLRYRNGEQNWESVDIGHKVPFASITGGIFEFGLSDAILQMWAGFLYELKHKNPLKRFVGCVTPEEAAMSHRLFTAALESQKNSSTVALK